jgi:hypothetical protein
MSSQSSISLPPLPAEHADWIQYMSARPDISMTDLVAPYKEYESKLRNIYAQDPDHHAVDKQHVVPLFTGHEKDVRIRARDLAAESEIETDRYIMPLQSKDRKKNNEAAIVQSLKEFQTNFQLFSESSLVDLDWSNIVVAGSAVSLLSTAYIPCMLLSMLITARLPRLSFPYRTTITFPNGRCVTTITRSLLQPRMSTYFSTASLKKRPLRR